MMKNTMAPNKTTAPAKDDDVKTPVYVKGTQKLPMTHETELPSCASMGFYVNPRVQMSGDFPDLNTQLQMLEKCKNYKY